MPRIPPARGGNPSLSPTTTISGSRAVLCCAVPPRRRRFPAGLSPPSPLFSSFSATRLPPSPSGPAPSCRPCLQSRRLGCSGCVHSQSCWEQWQEPSRCGPHGNEDGNNNNNNNNNNNTADLALQSMVMLDHLDLPAQCGSRLAPGYVAQPCR